MHRSHFMAWALGLAIMVSGVQAQNVAAVEATSLRQAYLAAWSRQPEALALDVRREAARAHQRSAQSWTPEPAALEVDARSDRFLRNLGTREYEVGLSIPLWLPGERSQSQQLADAEVRVTESRFAAAQLRVAAQVREAWWAWHRTSAEADSARGQLDSARLIAADVAKRLKAGDLARADQHQADGVVATAEASAAQAEASVDAALQALRSLTAMPALGTSAAATRFADAEAQPTHAPSEIDTHGELLALKDRAAAAQSVVALAATQSRANPELRVFVIRDRGALGERYQQSIGVGLRFPWGGGPRHESRVAAARAESVEAQAQLSIERARLDGERDSVRRRTEAARLQLTAAERRAALARESRSFFDKSFRLGETDLPTRLRIEAEASEAIRQAARARIELAASISSWRQALGLLPQ